MRTTTINSKVVEIYDDIESLPIKRFHKYNKMLLIDAGVGSDLNDIDAHIAKVIAFIKDNKQDDAVTEMYNLRQSIYFVQSGVSPRLLAFTTLVKSIDGQPCDDLSDNGLMRVYESLGNIPTNEMTSLFGEVKKKIDDELRMYFPQYFDSSESKEFHDIMRRRTLAKLQEIESGEKDNDAEALDIKLLTYNKPKDFTNGKAEIEHDLAFERSCHIISQDLHIRVKDFSVIEFYTALQYIKEEQEGLKKSKKGK